MDPDGIGFFFFFFFFFEPYKLSIVDTIADLRRHSINVRAQITVSGLHVTVAVCSALRGVRHHLTGPGLKQ